MKYLFDSIIFGFLAVDGVLVVIFALKAKPKRKISWAYFGVFLISLFAWGVIFYGSFVEPQLLVVKNQNIKLTGFSSQNVRAVLASDIHVGPYKQTGFVEKLVTKIMAQKPDMILLGGDFVYDDSKYADYLKYLDPLQKLSAPLGVFAVLGNHDYGNGETAEGGQNQAKTITEKLKELGVQVLINNDWIMGEEGIPNFVFLGINDLWAPGLAEIYHAVSALQESPVRPVILFSHNPDIVKFAQEKNVDLVIAGHTHGGQIRLPFIGSVPAIPDELGRKYDCGLFNFGKTQLFITSGAGEIGPRARLFVPPEIVVLNLEF